MPTTIPKNRLTSGTGRFYALAAPFQTLSRASPVMTRQGAEGFGQSESLARRSSDLMVRPASEHDCATTHRHESKAAPPERTRDFLGRSTDDRPTPLLLSLLASFRRALSQATLATRHARGRSV